MRSLQEYRDTLDKIGAGTVSADFAREILDAAEAELEEARGEFTLAQAMEKSGRSRSYFERRMPDLAARGLARKPGREWLLKAAAIPAREVHGGFDPALSVNELVDALDDLDRAG